MNLKFTQFLVVVVISLSCGATAFAATAPSLGTAQSYSVLAGSTVTNTGTTTLTGDLGLWPGLSITGFPPGTVTGTVHVGDAAALQAQSDLVTAYNELAGQACDVDLTDQDLGGMTLIAGVYCFATSAQLTGTLTLDAQGDPDAVFVFKIGSTLTTASSSIVQLINGGSNCNVFWQVGSSATLGTSSNVAGSILALTSITLTTSATVTGQLLARNGAVTLDTSNVEVCIPICPPITLNPSVLPSGIVGQAYSQIISAVGGSAPYTYSVTAGSLPTGAPAFMLDPNTGELSGTPDAAGFWDFTVTAVDSQACEGFRAYRLTINEIGCPTLTLLPAQIPNAEIGTPYSQAITASGSIPDTYVYTVTGLLPPGIELTPTTPPAIKEVALVGTPIATGSFNFTITATDANNCQVSQDYLILVNPDPCPEILVSPETLPDPVVGVPYSQTISASGGAEPYTFALTAGSLPALLVLDSNSGMISGTPTTSGNFAFTITAFDVNGCPGLQDYTFLSACPEILISPETLPDPVVGVPYSQTISASGGAEPYTFSLTAGSLPPLLVLNPNTGMISGTPTTSGNFAFTITATDANGCPGLQDYTFLSGCPEILVSPETLPDPVVGVPYSQTISASGGAEPYTFALTAGSLPPLLVLNPNTGMISGTPTTSGNFFFTITATDANGCPGLQEYAFLMDESTVPTLSEWGMFAFIGLLGLAGIGFMRRKVLL